MGRRSKLTPETQEAICENIRLGMTYEDAAQAAGVCNTTFYEWRKRGEAQKSGKYAEFAKALSGAEADGQRERLEFIRAHHRKDWRSAAWIQERRHPDTWGPRQEVTVKGEQEITLRWPDADNTPDATQEPEAGS